MNKKTVLITGSIVGFLLIGGGIFAYTSSNSQNTKQENNAIDTPNNTNSVSTPDNLPTQASDTSPEQSNPMNETDTSSQPGSYVTLSHFESNPSEYADSTKVYFFHASWCPICRSIDEDIKADLSVIPAGVTIIKTDFDSATALRKKYGVTSQTTFVQVDKNGNETAQWSATSLKSAIAGIEL